MPPALSKPVAGRDWVALICNRSGTMKREMKAEWEARGYSHVDVWSIDTQSTKDPNETFHKQGDWLEMYKELKRDYKKPPINILANTPCDWNTYECPYNFRPDGRILPMDEERQKLKKYWIDVVWKLLLEPCPVVMCENPMGFMDKVIRRADGSKVYVTINPWNFIAPGETFNEENWHDKRTRIFSGGNAAAIAEHPLTNYILMHERLPEVIDHWVEKQVDDAIDTAANKRSVTPTGMARAQVKCAIDRYETSKGNVMPRVELKYNEEEVSPPPAEKKMCNNNIKWPDGTERFICNLRFLHDAKHMNFKRGGEGLVCGHMDYKNNVYIDKEDFPSEKFRERLIPEVHASILDPMEDVQDIFNNDTPEPPKTVPNKTIYKKRVTYKCSKCGMIKKGHVCAKVNDTPRTISRKNHKN